MRKRVAPAVLALAVVGCAADTETGRSTPAAIGGPQEAASWAADVVIHRDDWGVPHIRASTDAAVAFGSAWAQCEDHFFQLEDTYIKALGRYAEVVGESGFRSDLEVALFDLVGASRRDFPKLPEHIQRIAEGFAAGYNDYLEKHPDETPRLLTRMEPFHVLAFERYMMLGRLLGAAHAPRGRLPRLAEELAASLGSNQWAVAPSKTRDGAAMLFINPHQPWYGSGMFTEMHVVSDEGLNFSGAMFPGSPLPTAGFNERLGWAYTVNAADISDTYRLTFDHPTDPLKYRYGEGWRDAEEWRTTIRVRGDDGEVEPREVALRRSHYGPIVAREDDTHYLAVRVPRLYDGSRMVQALAQAKATNFDEWYAAVSMQLLQTFNTTYADADGNIFYLYNGTIARRDPSVDWTKPVDGADPNNEWGPFHPIEELPQVLNPPSGYVQNCNSTPFTTTDDGNPSLLDFPPYMVEDKHDDKRRARMARYLLRNASDLTFEDFQDLAYDTTLYWPMTELPVYGRRLETLERTDPDLAARVRPYLEHLLDWNYKSSLTSTQATLAVGWYEELYGRGYPRRDPEARVRERHAGPVRRPGAGRMEARRPLRRLEGALRRHPPHPAPRQPALSRRRPLLRRPTQPAAGRRPRPPRRRLHPVPLAAHHPPERRRTQAPLRRDRRLLHGRLRVRRENPRSELPPLRPEPPARVAPLLRPGHAALGTAVQAGVALLGGRGGEHGPALPAGRLLSPGCGRATGEIDAFVWHSRCCQPPCPAPSKPPSTAPWRTSCGASTRAGRLRSAPSRPASSATAPAPSRTSSSAIRAGWPSSSRRSTNPRGR